MFCCRSLLIISVILGCSSSVFPQCNIVPQTSVTGNRCAGSELRIQSNILPESVKWELNGSLVSTQSIVLSSKAVTVAGGNGPGNAMDQLYNPDRLFVDAAGVIYVPDLTNNRVQKWLPGATSGITVAGGNGQGSAANQFSRPSSVFVDQQGNIYVTDQNNGRVQKWAPGAASGTTVATGITYPTDVFVDKSGNMYVSDQWSNVVRKYAPGSLTGVAIAGNYSYGSDAYSLNAPTGIFVDEAGTLYVCDTDNNRVQKFLSGSMAGITVASGFTPLDVSVDCSGNVFIVDYWNSKVVKYSPGSATGVTAAGGNGSGNAADQLNTPIGVFIVGSSSLYVADYGNHRVQRFSTSIDPRFTANLPGTYSITVNYPCCPSYTEVVEIYNQQQPSVDITATNTAICPGDPVTFTARNLNSIVDPVYRWVLNGTTVGGNSPTYQNSTLKDKDELHCMLASSRDCTAPVDATSNIIMMNVFAPVPLQLNKNVIACPDEPVLLQVPAIYDTYTWQDNSTLPSLTVNKPGTYSVTVTDACRNSFSESVIVSLHNTAKNFLPRDTIVCPYDFMTLKPSADFTKFLWSNQSTAPSVLADRAGTYWLKAVDKNNCEVSDTVHIQFKTCPPRDIYMPNAFSPNNDGKNDVFKPAVYGVIRSYKLVIYNRFGQQIFISSTPGKGWDGTERGLPTSSGTYVWVCQFELEGQKAIVKKGTVVVIK